MRIAALDVGSNSFHLIVAEVETGGRIQILDRAKEMVRLGDGSLEVILADAQELYFASSLKLGVIRLAETSPCSDPPTPRERAQLAERARSMLDPVVARVRAMGFDFVGLTSGTALALADLMRQDRGNGARAALTLKALTDLEKRLGAMRTIERARLPGLDGRRADTIYVGA